MTTRIAIAGTFALGTLLLTAVPALAQTPAAKPAPVCLQRDRIYSWDPINKTAVAISDPFNRKYKVTLQVPCFDLDYRQQIELKSSDPSSLSCVGTFDSVVVRRDVGFPRQECRIKSVEVYTPAMQKADAALKKSK